MLNIQNFGLTRVRQNIVLNRAEEEHVHPNTVDAQPTVSHVLSGKAGYGSWKCGLPECSYRDEFALSQVVIWH